MLKYPLFRVIIFFTFTVQSRFKWAAVVSFSLQVVVSLPGAAVFTPANLCYPLLRGLTFRDPIPPLLLYIKPPLPFNKQFSIDSFLYWERLHWDFRTTFASPPYFVTFSASAPKPKQVSYLFVSNFQSSETFLHI